MDDERGAAVVERLRAGAFRVAAEAAGRLRDVEALETVIRAQLAAEPPSLLGDVLFDESDAEALVEGEVVAALGVGQREAGRLLRTARRLHDDLPQTLTALETGRLDPARAQVLCDLTRDLPGPVARLVQDAVLPDAGASPWDGPSAVLWRRRVARAVKRFRLDAATAEAESLAAQTRTWVQVDPDQPALATFSVVAPTEDILWLEQQVTACALQRPDTDTRGRSLTMGQRRVAVVFDMFGQLAAGDDCAAAGSESPERSAARGRERELGLVMHADTFFDDGPADHDPGEVRGIGAPAPVTASAARELAHGRSGAASTCVLLADDHGALQRLVRVGHAPAGGWTRGSLVAAVRARIAEEAAAGRDRLSTDRYPPTRVISDHVKARYPTCTRPGCHRASRDCDLDHDEPWPRGPTSVPNLNPKSRRCHRWKTLNLWRSAMHPDGSIAWTTYASTRLTYRPEPLPGHGPGEAYDAARTATRSDAPAT